MQNIAQVKDRARRREAAGDLERALELYLKALRQGTDGRGGSVDPGLCVRVADLSAEMGRGDDALRFYRQGARLFAEQRLVPNAVGALKKILGLEPDDVRAHRQLADLHLEVGHVSDARTHLLRYFEQCAVTGRASEAEETLERMRDTFPDDQFVEQAEACVEQARERLEELEEDPSLVEDAEDAGDVADLLATLEESARSVEPAASGGEPAAEDEAAAGPDGAPSGTPAGEGASAAATGGPGLHPSLEEVLDELREFQEGSETSGEPRPLTPLPKTVPHTTGEAGEEEFDEEALGERAELRKGLQVLEELLELAPDSADLHRRKVGYALRLGEREALEEAWVGLGRSLAENGATRAARQAYREALALQPEQSTALSGLARLDAIELEEKKVSGETAGSHNRTRRMKSAEDHEVRQQLGRRLWTEFEESMRQLPWLDGATKTFRAAGAEFLPPLEAYELLGRYLVARQKYDEAIRVMEMALEVEGLEEEDLADLLYHLGTCYEQVDRLEEARDCYERVSAADDEFRKAWKGTRPGHGAQEGPAGEGGAAGEPMLEVEEEEGELTEE